MFFMQYIVVLEKKMVFSRGGKTGPSLADDDMEFSDFGETAAAADTTYYENTNNVLLDLLANLQRKLKRQEELQIWKDTKIKELEQELDTQRALAALQAKVGLLEEVIERLTEENKMLKQGQA
ncbi:hypothetical protein BDP27DRAFT_1366600 [Rhodocollybia butyracea]|uniref:Uncharacterized protein n=1 Tax=Rhodocollybia butyracea TaxID=206335 RepID=A0A9P5PGG5_9AGAR|nr:hypothetical protein BDP27DRAFT_1366600 [Rhodocollybia butyracea]